MARKVDRKSNSQQKWAKGPKRVHSYQYQYAAGINSIVNQREFISSKTRFECKTQTFALEQRGLNPRSVVRWP